MTLTILDITKTIEQKTMEVVFASSLTAANTKLRTSHDYS